MASRLVMSCIRRGNAVRGQESSIHADGVNAPRARGDHRCMDARGCSLVVLLVVACTDHAGNCPPVTLGAPARFGVTLKVRSHEGDAPLAAAEAEIDGVKRSADASGAIALGDLDGPV